MSKNKVKNTADESNCFIQAPTWQCVKTKRLAYEAGHSDGYVAGLRAGRAENEKQVKELKDQQKQVKTDAIKAIAQSTAQMTEASAHALLYLTK